MREAAGGYDRILHGSRQLWEYGISVIPADQIRPSNITLPEITPEGVQTVLDFFIKRFAHIDRETWFARFSSGKVWSSSGVLDPSSVYRPLEEVHYRREVDQEPPVRTDYSTIWEDDDLLVVDKPPNLPVIPGGPWVRHTLLHLLEQQTGNSELVPLHRIDRLTSGLVVFSKRRSTRTDFTTMFQFGAPIEKTYTAVCEVGSTPPVKYAFLEHHIAPCPERFWLQITIPGPKANAHSIINLIDADQKLALYSITPSTGRRHQIRVQLAAAGFPIAGDPLYGSDPCKDPDNRGRRMWLDAHRLTLAHFQLKNLGKSLSAEWISSRTPEQMWQGAHKSL